MTKAKSKKQIPPEPDKKSTPEELSNYYETYLDDIEIQELEPEELKTVSHSLDKALKAYKKERSQLNLSLPDDILSELKQVAKQKGAPVSTLVRMWIIEKLHPERAFN